MKEETFKLSTNIMSLIALVFAVLFYIFDAYNHAIFLMGLAIYLKE